MVWDGETRAEYSFDLRKTAEEEQARRFRARVLVIVGIGLVLMVLVLAVARGADRGQACSQPFAEQNVGPQARPLAGALSADDEGCGG